MPVFLQNVITWAQPITDTAMDWLASPAAWSQFALLAYVLTAVGAALTRSLFGSGALAPIMLRLSVTMVELGNIRFSVLSLIRGLIAGSLLFWLGGWSNRQSSEDIQRQKELRPATRQLAVKAAKIFIFSTAFLLMMSIMSIELTTIAVLGVGIGLGLQHIAAHFVSGVILLIEGQTTVGDYVELDGGEAGIIVKMTSRACVLEPSDGKWIVVPNDHFITTRVVEYSDQGSANRYAAALSVSYDNDINTLPARIDAAVTAPPFILPKPDGPDCKLRGFGDSGSDDGKNKDQSKVLFAIWNALRDAGGKIPYPHRVVEIKGVVPQL